MDILVCGNFSRRVQECGTGSMIQTLPYWTNAVDKERKHFHESFMAFQLHNYSFALAS